MNRAKIISMLDELNQALRETEDVLCKGVEFTHGGPSTVDILFLRLEIYKSICKFQQDLIQLDAASNVVVIKGRDAA